MFLNSNSSYKFLKSYILSRSAYLQNIWHLLIIHTHELLSSLPHDDIRIVIWPIIVLKFSYDHHQMFQTPFKVFRICCFFHNSRPPLCKIYGLQDSLDRDWRPITSLTSSCVPSCRYQRSFAFALICKKIV